MPKLDVLNLAGQPVGSIDLADDVFAAEVNEHLLWEAVKWQLAKRRAGTHSTKRRDEVSGTKKKPFKQKGTGRARQGSHRSPQWVGGGSVFGPKPRDYEYAFPKKARKNALRAALSLRASEKKLVVVDAFTVDGKTKSLVGALAALGIAKVPTLLVVRELAEGLTRAARNVPWLTVETPPHVSVYQLLHAHRVVFERAGLVALEEALAK